MPKTLTVMIGIQGSSKSTFCRKRFADSYVYINLDTLKTRAKEKILFEESIKNGQNIVIDNTNPTAKDRERYIPIAKAAGYRIAGYFMQSVLADCLERNNRRTGIARVPESAIAATSNKLEMPSYSEGFDELYFVKLDGEETIIEKWRE